MPELLECPFCGSQVEAVEDWEGGQEVEYVLVYYVYCEACETCGPRNDNSKEEAVRFWNKRIKS